jgi:hypothetical protein
MADNPQAKESGSAPASMERRAWVRYACDLSGSCQPVSGSRDRTWAARVQDISRGGLRLVVTRRFEPGTLLEIDLTDVKQIEVQSVLARVIHVTTQSLGMWCLGCSFHRELSEDDVRALRSESESETR